MKRRSLFGGLLAACLAPLGGATSPKPLSLVPVVPEGFGLDMAAKSDREGWGSVWAGPEKPMVYDPNHEIAWTAEYSDDGITWTRYRSL